MRNPSLAEQLASARERFESESAQAHRLSVVLRAVILDEPYIQANFEHAGDRVEMRLYGATRADGGSVLIVERLHRGGANMRVASLDAEQRYWSQWVPPSNCDDARLKFRDAVEKLYVARNRIVLREGKREEEPA